MGFGNRQRYLLGKQCARATAHYLAARAGPRWVCSALLWRVATLWGEVVAVEYVWERRGVPAIPDWHTPEKLRAAT